MSLVILTATHRSQFYIAATHPICFLCHRFHLFQRMALNRLHQIIGVTRIRCSSGGHCPDNPAPLKTGWVGEGFLFSCPMVDVFRASYVTFHSCHVLSLMGVHHILPLTHSAFFVFVVVVALHIHEPLVAGGPLLLPGDPGGSAVHQRQVWDHRGAGDRVRPLGPPQLHPVGVGGCAVYPSAERQSSNQASFRPRGGDVARDNHPRITPTGLAAPWDPGFLGWDPSKKDRSLRPTSSSTDTPWVKPEPPDVDGTGAAPEAAAVVPVGCCDVCAPAARAAAPPHSDVAEKRRQRRRVVEDVERVLAAGVSPQVNVLLFDDWLPTDEDSTAPRLLTEELVAHFAPRMGPGVRLRIFSPNLRAAIVEALALVAEAAKEHGNVEIVTAVGCFHHFLYHYQRRVGAAGFHVVMADVHPGHHGSVSPQQVAPRRHRDFFHGCVLLLSQLDELALFADGCRLSFAVSVLGARLVLGWSRELAVGRILDEFKERNPGSPYRITLAERERYRTMVTFEGTVTRDVRAIDAVNIEGFTVTCVMTETVTGSGPAEDQRPFDDERVDDSTESNGGQPEDLSMPSDTLFTRKRKRSFVEVH